jgi:glycosyltransferase involved in cell wall biosynthesis
MYDALNKGFERASGEIFAHLNCDEQYLPGTLSRVADFFLSRPSVDIVFGGFLILNPDNTLACHRVATPARAAMIRTAHLYNFTCATFYRRRVWEAGLRFRPDLKAIADGEFIAAILEAGFRPATLPNYLATFTLTGKNLSADHATREEEARQRALLPRWMQLATPWLSRVRHLEKLMRGAYARPRIVYDIYPSADADARTTFTALNAEWRFPTYTDNGPNTETV